MKTYRFEISAYEEIDIEAETKEEAEEKAKEYWDEKFSTMFGGVEFVSEVENEGQGIKRKVVKNRKR